MADILIKYPFVCIQISPTSLIQGKNILWIFELKIIVS